MNKVQNRNPSQSTNPSQRANQPQSMGKPLIIACTGDSHTWGQGGAGAKTQYETWQNPVVAGEHRLMPWTGLGYVTLLRELVNTATHSRATEYRAETLSVLWNCPIKEDCVSCTGESLVFEGFLLRLQFRYSEQETWVRILIDGKPVREENLCRAGRKHRHNLVTLRLEDGLHTLEIESDGKGRSGGDEVLLHRAEAYSGACAVVNCGVGSCPVSRFLPEYAESYVDVLQPDIVVAQGHTINDWLTVETPEDYAKALEAYLTHERERGARAVFLTVEPILGNQLSSCGATFAEYIAASRKIAEELQIPVADAAAEMERRMEGLSEEERFALWYEDKWHPNFRGHRLYAECAWEQIKAIS